MTNDLANYPHYIEHLIMLDVIFVVLKCFIYNVTWNSFSVLKPSVFILLHK